MFGEQLKAMAGGQVPQEQGISQNDNVMDPAEMQQIMAAIKPMMESMMKQMMAQMMGGQGA